jgi:hypothetical protein
LIFRFVHSQVGASVGKLAYAAALACIPPHPAQSTLIDFSASSPDASEKVQSAMIRVVTERLRPGEPQRLDAPRKERLQVHLCFGFGLGRLRRSGDRGVELERVPTIALEVRQRDLDVEALGFVTLDLLADVLGERLPAVAEESTGAVSAQDRKEAMMRVAWALVTAVTSAIVDRVRLAASVITRSKQLILWTFRDP